MQKKFLKNLAFTLIINLLIKPFWIFGIDRNIQNTVGTEAYGLYFALLNLSFIFSFMIDMGFNNFTNRIVAQNEVLAKKYLSILLNIKLLLSMAYFGITILVAFSLGYSGYAINMLVGLCINQALLQMVLYFRANISGLQWLTRDSMLSAMDKLIAAALCLPILLGMSGFGIEWFVLAQGLGLLITMAVSILWLRQKIGVLKLTFNKKLFLVILKQSWPYALLTLIMVLYTRTDAILIERLLLNGKDEAGKYATGYRLYDAANMIAFLFSSLLLPLFAKGIKQKMNIQPLVSIGVSLLIVPSFLLVALCFKFQNEILSMLYTNTFTNSGLIFSLLMLAFIGTASNYIFGTLLTANGSIKLLNTIALCMLLVNLTLNFILIPKYGILGAAITAMCTQVLSALVQALVCYNIFKLRLNIFPSLAFALWIVAMCVILNINFMPLWYINALFLVIFSLFYFMLTKIIPVKALFQSITKANN